MHGIHPELIVRQRNQALVDQVAVRAGGIRIDKCRDVVRDARDPADMRLLDVEVERPGNRIGAIRGLSLPHS